MLTFLDKLFGLAWLGKLGDWLNGSKTILGLIAILIHVLEIVPSVFPEFGFAPDIAKFIQEALLYAGIMLPWGVAHKAIKSQLHK